MSDATARYEFLALRFRRDTGLMAPGKDAPACVPDNLEERRAAWDEWLTSPKGYMARGAFEERALIVRKMHAWPRHICQGELTVGWGDVEDTLNELETP